MAMATEEYVTAAIGTLERRTQEHVAAELRSAEARMMESLTGTIQQTSALSTGRIDSAVTAAMAEQHADILTRVDTDVGNRFEATTTRLTMLFDDVRAQFQVDRDAFAAQVTASDAATQIKLEVLEKKFEALGAGNLDKVAPAILDFHATDQARMDLLQRLHADQTAKNETIMQQHDGALRNLSLIL